MPLPFSHTRRSAAFAALLVVAACAVASAHEGDLNYRSTVQAVVPATPGLHVRVVNYDDALQLVNRSGRDVVVFGYAGEPYARVLADGRVQVNERSQAVSLNEDAGQHETPSRRPPSGAPRWRTLDGTGRLEWHDHRIHYRAGAVPPQVHDTGRRTKVFDWSVPLRVDGRPGSIAGTLVWVGSAHGSSSGFPAAAAISLAVLVLAAAAAVALARRRRARGR
jgi:hypothetical protein